MDKTFLCGDVHGKTDKLETFYSFLDGGDKLIQLGDIGFSRAWQHVKRFSSPLDFLCIAGNHDHRMAYETSEVHAGDYGFNEDFTSFPFFFIRGGISLDRHWRINEELAGNPKTWWSSEELNFSQMLQCLDLYKWAKPSIMFTHAAPTKIKNLILGENKEGDFPRKFGFEVDWDENTGFLIDECIKIHKPDIHVFGHLHKSFNKVVDGCRYICLNEMETVEINQYLKF